MKYKYVSIILFIGFGF